MLHPRFLVPALIVLVLISLPTAATIDAEHRALVQLSAEAADRAAFSEFAQRVRAYMDLRRDVERTVPPLRVTANPAEIRQAVDALAMAIRVARPDAQQGDIFTAEAAMAVRRAVATTCHEYVNLLALVTEELESPLPPPTIHMRWPDGAPLPTMPLDLLAALPRLPHELEYRFVNHDLVLRDIDANLVIDYVPDAIPAITTR